MSETSPFDGLDDEPQVVDQVGVDDADANDDDPFGDADAQDDYDEDDGLAGGDLDDGAGGGDDPFGLGGASADADADADADELVEDDADDPFAGQYTGGSGDAAVTLDGDMDDDEFDGDSPLAKWEEERGKVIQARVEKERADKIAAKEKAAKEVEDFYAKLAQDLEKAQALNRNEEANNKSECDTLMKSGTVWQKVDKTIDLAPRANEDFKVARMRKLLLELKNERPAEQ